MTRKLPESMPNRTVFPFWVAGAWSAHLWDDLHVTSDLLWLAIQTAGILAFAGAANYAERRWRSPRVTVTLPPTPPAVHGG